MNTIHLDLQGKTARVLFQPLPETRPKLQVRLATAAGAVAAVRLTNGLNPQVDPAGSAKRKEPLKVVTECAYTEERAGALARKLLAENVTKGFVPYDGAAIG